jgi:NDP-sugar pyrophosphorylase family protein
MQLLIPAAGAGSRFAKAGYTLPKPLIDVNGKPMLRHVLDNLAWCEPTRTVVLTQRYFDGFDDVTQKHVDGLTEGAACTALLAEGLLAADEPLIIANSDQLIEWGGDMADAHHLLSCFDGALWCFDAPDRSPKWSYVLADAQTGVIHTVREKQPISTRATCGIYYYAKADYFFRSARAMMAMNDRFNNEFYMAPTFNYLIAAGKHIVDLPVTRMHGLGTPEDLQKYLDENH